MKKYLIIITIASIICFAAILKHSSVKESPYMANIEALSDDEELDPAVISCDTQGWGQCYIEVNAFPFRKCNWTGCQSDFCDCD